MRMRLKLLFTMFLLLAMPAAHAGEYSISPMRLSFDRETRSGIVTLANLGTDKLSFQLSVMEWTQDPEGRDRYAPTSEVIFFPRILTLEPREERVVRVGIKSPSATQEQSYRLFIEKLPDSPPERVEVSPGMKINVNIRFALPVFVRPASPQVIGELVDAKVANGALTLALANRGNEHYRLDEGIGVRGLDAQGAEIYTHTFDDRYVLAGVVKRYAAKIPPEACRRIATLELNGHAEGFTLDRKLAVAPGMCE